MAVNSLARTVHRDSVISKPLQASGQLRPLISAAEPSGRLVWRAQQPTRMCFGWGRNWRRDGDCGFPAVRRLRSNGMILM
uniref:Uncharacterized protein n=1 Tax=Macrostomum lignano TaxID=282301 RepID=A0A1I8GKG9_9PLAT